MIRASDDGHDTVLAWLDEMQTCVNLLDYERCRQIFARDATGFGTRAYLVRGLAPLERDQWRHIWPTITGFTFVLGDLVWSRAGDTIWIACPWISTLRANGSERPGRMTAILEERDGKWVAIHTHHSISP